MAQQLHRYMQIQPDWQELATAMTEDASGSEEERCWLDVYERSVRLESGNQSNDDDDKLRVQIQSPASAHFELELSAPAGQRFEPKDVPSQQHLVEIAKQESHWVEVHAHVGGGDMEEKQQTVRTVFQAPTAIMNVTAPDGVKRQLYTVDVSNDEKLIAVGGADGLCALWDALDRTEAFVLSGHLLDVTRVRFFPSSKVLLTGSLDFTLRIWSADTGQCAAVLKGHRGGIEDIAILGRGRNVLSSSSDGLIHLWSCGTQEVIAKWSNDAQSAVHCLSVLDDSATKTLACGGSGSSPQNVPELHDLESETECKVLFAGLENGETLGVDIRMRDLVMNLRGTGSAILSCCASAGGAAPRLLTGSEDGILTTWDLRNTSSPLQLLSPSSSPINRIAVVPAGKNASLSAWTAHGDGVCCNWSHLSSADHSVASVSTVLTGPLYDPVRDLAITPRTGRVLTVCRDGLLRDYIPHLL